MSETIQQIDPVEVLRNYGVNVSSDISSTFETYKNVFGYDETQRLLKEVAKSGLGIEQIESILLSHIAEELGSRVTPLYPGSA